MVKALGALQISLLNLYSYENCLREILVGKVNKRVEGADKILDYYRALKGAFLCIRKNKRILHYGYIIKQSL